MNISVLGAGAWGCAVASAAANAGRSHKVCLWARDAAQAQAMHVARENARYLPGVRLPESLQITADWQEALRHGSDLLIIATPMSGLAPTLQAIRQSLWDELAGDGAGCEQAPRLPGILWLCKGFQAGTGALGHEIARDVFPQARVGILSGPSFAQEVALRQPTALVAASTDAGLCQMGVDALHSDFLRVYTSADPVGVEVGGAVKNVLAIATGIADGMPNPARPDAPGLGLNARAALITRGLAEMTRLGVALGAKAETFMGLSGLGDLVLTATGDLSRNRKVGLLLAQGLSLEQILSELGHVAEGARSAAVVLQRARACRVDMPITEAVTRVLAGEVSPASALGQLMGRQSKQEA
jgi:glycerol-3-phosphate dehydrogenase (NAD(P)+)